MIGRHDHMRARTCAGRFIAAVAAVCMTGVAAAQLAPAPFEPLNIMGPDPAQQFKDVAIEQRLDAQVPLELLFRDEAGSEITLGEAMDGKATILALVYYRCPGVCNGILNGVRGVIDAMKYQIGEEYSVVTVSIDPKETPELAQGKKQSYLEEMHRDGVDAGWHFLTGDEVGIERIANAVGFRYAYDPNTDQYAHAAGIMVLTPQGRVARYYYGVEYLARDVEFGLVEASNGRIGSLVDQVTMLCFQYDPATGRYGFYVIGAMRIMAVLMILGFATMYAILYFRSRRNSNGGGASPAGVMPAPVSGPPRA